MNSIAFPKMFKSSATLVKKDDEATMQNLKLLCFSESGEMEGDPGYGVSVRKYTYDQNASPLRVLLTDELFSKIKVFMPQLTVNMKDIKIIQKGKRTYITLQSINKNDFTTNMYELVLFQEDER